MTNAPTPAGMAESPMSIAMGALTRLASGTARTFNAATAGQMAASTTAIASDALNRILAAQPSAGAMSVDSLAQEIRRVDGSNSLGAGALAEALRPFVTAAPVQPNSGGLIEKITKWAGGVNGRFASGSFGMIGERDIRDLANTISQPDSGGVVEALREAIPDLSSVIAWLDNGCDPKHAADELRIYKSRIDQAALAPVAAGGGNSAELDEAINAVENWTLGIWPDLSIGHVRTLLSALRTEPTGGGEGA